jgi:hypothetical protein
MDNQAATKARLGRVRVVSSALARATEELNQSFQRVESALQSCGCTIEVSTVIPAEAHEGYRRGELVLCWSRLSGGWGLAIARNIGGELEESKPIAQASRDFRVRAVWVLDSLVEEIERELELARAAVSRASAEARQFAEAITPLQISSGGGGSDEDIPF